MGAKSLPCSAAKASDTTTGRARSRVRPASRRARSVASGAAMAALAADSGRRGAADEFQVRALFNFDGAGHGLEIAVDHVRQ